MLLVFRDLHEVFPHAVWDLSGMLPGIGFYIWGLLTIANDAEPVIRLVRRPSSSQHFCDETRLLSFSVSIRAFGIVSKRKRQSAEVPDNIHGRKQRLWYIQCHDRDYSNSNPRRNRGRRAVHRRAARSITLA